MKAVTINVSDPAYREFQEYARRHDRTASELIRQAMEEFRERHIRRTVSLRDLRPFSAGGPIQPVSHDDDTLGEMLDAARR